MLNRLMGRILRCFIGKSAWFLGCSSKNLERDPFSNLFLSWLGAGRFVPQTNFPCKSQLVLSLSTDINIYCTLPWNLFQFTMVYVVVTALKSLRQHREGNEDLVHWPRDGAMSTRASSRECLSSIPAIVVMHHACEQ